MSSSPEGAAGFIWAVQVVDAFSVKDLRIPVSGGPQEKRHLFLTGPNGSGKSSILRGLYRDLAEELPPAVYVPWKASEEDRQGRFRTEPVETHPPSPPHARGLGKDSADYGLAYNSASRTTSFNSADGPRQINWALRLTRDTDTAEVLQQFLINKKTDLLFARSEGDQAAGQKLDAWFQRTTRALAKVLNVRDVDFVIDRPSYEVSLSLDGRRSPLQALPDGYGSILRLWADLALRQEAEDHPIWFCIIDEPELHLHPALEERVMPFLLEAFENTQFFVATHSPAVISSVDGATVYDLGLRDAVNSEDLRGTRYGTLMKEHFGIESDFDLKSTEELRRLQELRLLKPAPDSDEWKEMKTIADRLSGRSHAMAMEVAYALELERPA